MKIIDIVGDNYLGKWNKTRTACRGIVIKGENILMSYETKNDQWMIPGGGLEKTKVIMSVALEKLLKKQVY